MVAASILQFPSGRQSHRGRLLTIPFPPSADDVSARSRLSQVEAGVAPVRRHAGYAWRTHFWDDPDPGPEAAA